MTWTDRRILNLFGIEHPIIQAPMTGCTIPEMVIAASVAGGLELSMSILAFAMRCSQIECSMSGRPKLRNP